MEVALNWVKDRGQKSFEVYASKSIHTAMNEVLKSRSGEDSEKEGCRERFSPVREYLSGGEWYISKNMDVQDHSNKVSDGNEEHVIE